MKLPQSTTHLLAAVFLLAIMLRFPWLGAKSLWLDEALSYQLRTPVMADVDFIHPPLYYVLINYTVALLGRSEAAIRLPSAIFSTINLGLIYLLGFKLVSRRTGLLAAALLAVSPLDIWYAQEARVYATLACAVLCMAVGLVWRHWAGFLLYFVGLLAALHLHFLSVPIWLALSALWLVYWRRMDGKLLHLALWLTTSAAAWWLFRPWLPKFLAARWLAAPARSLFGVTDLSPLQFATGAGLISLGLVMVALVAPRLLRVRRWRQLVTVLALIGTLVVLVLVPVPRLYALKRLIYTAWGLVVLLVAWLVMQLQAYRKLTLGLLLGISLTSSLVTIYMVPKDDWRGVVRSMNRQAPDAIVWLDPRWNEIVYGYYDPNREVLDESGAELEEVAARNEELWLVAERFHGRPIPSSPSEAWLDTHMELVETFPFYRLELRRYRRASS